MNTGLKENQLPTGQTIQIVQGDITIEEVDAIVNAANEHLQHGGGVAGAIARRGGPTIQKESNEWVRVHGLVSHAHPAWTSGGSLTAKYIIHAVGPIWGEGDENAKLTAAVSGSLRVADALGVGSIAMPAISTGIFGFPKRRAAALIFQAIDEYFQQNPETSVNLVKLVLYDEATVKAFMDAWDL
jgi:O-acetyl-ADP-ribose deacetylase (regulator of RNase III)